MLFSQVRQLNYVHESARLFPKAHFQLLVVGETYTRVNRHQWSSLNSLGDSSSLFILKSSQVIQASSVNIFGSFWQHDSIEDNVCLLLSQLVQMEISQQLFDFCMKFGKFFVWMHCNNFHHQGGYVVTCEFVGWLFYIHFLESQTPCAKP